VVSSATSTAALLQRAVPEGGAGVVTMESTGELSGHGGGQTEAQRAKPTLPGARQEPKITSRGSRFGRREGNH